MVGAPYTVESSLRSLGRCAQFAEETRPDGNCPTTIAQRPTARAHKEEWRNKR